MRGTAWSQQTLHYSEFDIFPLRFTTGDFLPTFDDVEELSVVEGIRFSSDFAFSNHRPVLWEHFTLHHKEQLPAKTRSSKPSTFSAPTDERQRLLLEHPWLTEDDLNRAFRSRVRAPGVGGGVAKGKVVVGKGLDGSDQSGDEIEAPLADPPAKKALVRFEGDPDELDAELARVREEFADRDFADVALPFYSRPLMGKWSVEYKGVVACAMGAFAKGGEPARWCRTYSFKAQYSNYFSRYGRLGATILTSEFCRRASYFYTLWLESDDPETFEYSQSDLDAYEEGFESINYCADLPVESPGFKRGQELRLEFPINPTELEG